MANEKILELANITKRFGDVTAVNDLSIPFVNRGEFVTFLGPSGCGKTTLLRMVAGFYYPTAWDIIVHGERINEIPPERRRTSMVFQNYALFLRMSVYENIAYCLKLRRKPREDSSSGSPWPAASSSNRKSSSSMSRCPTSTPA
jgi:iron(III) transport system ATP-binding protein